MQSQFFDSIEIANVPSISSGRSNETGYPNCKAKPNKGKEIITNNKSSTSKISDFFGRVRGDNNNENESMADRTSNEGVLQEQELLVATTVNINKASDESLRKKRKKSRSSEIWNYFEKNKEGKLFAKCTLCKQEYATSGNTSKLHDHLKRKHQAVLLNNEAEGGFDGNCENSPKRQMQKITTAFEKSKAYDKNNPKKIKLDKALVSFMAGGLHPFSIVSENNFIELMHLADPKYLLPSKSTLRNKLMYSIYNQQVELLKSLLHNVDWVALTSDLWSSRANEPYIALTCHFIYNNKFRSATLECKHIPGTHTSKNIKEATECIINDWGLNNKVVCIVTDNAQSMINAVDLLRVRHLPCFAHTINLVVTDALKDPSLNDLLQRCRAIVGHFKRSTVAAGKLCEEQNRYDSTKTVLKLIQDVPTRWNSTYYMLERLIKIWDPVMITLNKLTCAPPPLGAECLLQIKEIMNLLAPFEDATVQMSGDSYTTSSLIIPIVVEIHLKITTIGRNLQFQITKDVFVKLKESVERRLFLYEQRTVPRLATILDPRLKKPAFRSKENSSQAALLTQNELNGLIRSINNNVNAEVEERETSDTNDDNLLSFLHQRVSEQQETRTPTSDAIILIRQYLEKNNLRMETDPLDFWKLHDNPDFRTLAHKYLCVPATSVASERVFSKTGQIISDRRSRLNPDVVNKLTFLSQNQWLQK